MTDETDVLLPVSEVIRRNEAHAKWLYAFNWWFHNARLDRILSNLREGVALSRKNARFLAAILDRSAKPLSGKQTGLARFRSDAIDGYIRYLRELGLSRKQMLARLTGAEWLTIGGRRWEKSVDGLGQRLYRKVKSPAQRHADLEERFVRLYTAMTIEPSPSVILRPE